MLLDSTFFIDLLNNDPEAIEKLDELAEESTSVVLSPLTVFEVGVGLATGERERFDEIIASMTVVPVGLAESRRAVSIQRALRSTGEKIGVIDVLLAGTAAERVDSRMLTRNTDEFSRVEEIRVSTY